MRTFGTDKPELMAFKLEGSDDTYSLPLAASLPMMLRLQMAEAVAEPDDARREYLCEMFQVDFLSRYMGRETVDGLTMRQVQRIYAAWQEESAALGADAGE